MKGTRNLHKANRSGNVNRLGVEKVIYHSILEWMKESV